MHDVGHAEQGVCVGEAVANVRTCAERAIYLEWLLGKGVMRE